MNVVDWVMVVVYAVVAAGFGWMLPMLYRMSRRHPSMRTDFWVLTFDVVLTASVPVVMLATWGGGGLYAGVVSAAVLLTGIGFTWVRRGKVRAALQAGRNEKGGR